MYGVDIWVQFLSFQLYIALTEDEETGRIKDLSWEQAMHIISAESIKSHK
jgi:hypothetical protein